MSQKEKLLKRLLSRPSDFTFDEVEALLAGFGYEKGSKGKTSGSRVLFFKKENGHKIILHKPHPRKVLPLYAVDDVIRGLKEGGNI